MGQHTPRTSRTVVLHTSTLTVGTFLVNNAHKSNINNLVKFDVKTTDFSLKLLYEQILLI